MTWIWAKLISGIIFVLIPGFALKENYKKHPYLTSFSIALGLFLLFLSLKPLVEANYHVGSIEDRLKIIEEERDAKEVAEKERLAKEATEKERLAKEAAEKEKLAKEAAEKERLAKESAEKERLAKEIALKPFKKKEALAAVKNTRLPNSPHIDEHINDTPGNISYCEGFWIFPLTLKKYPPSEKKLAYQLSRMWQKKGFFDITVIQQIFPNSGKVVSYNVGNNNSNLRSLNLTLSYYQKMLDKADVNDDLSSASIERSCNI